MNRFIIRFPEQIEFSKKKQKELEQIQAVLEMEYPQGMSATQFNDLFWFDSETVKS